MMRYLIAGAGGMLGTALQAVLADRGRAFVAPPECEFDITDEAAVAVVMDRFASSVGPGEQGVVVNAAAYTNVERAEDEPATAFLVNETGPGLLAAAARSRGLRFVHVSTDFVFDGMKDGPYAETDEPNPLSVYGASKLAGERAAIAADPGALVVRTAWVFGPGGANFPSKILERAGQGGAMRVVTDEVGSPTYTLDLARAMLDLADRGATGVFHLAGTGECSRFELAAAVLALAGLDNAIEPVTSDLFPTRAARPANSVLDCSKAAALGVRMPAWRDALARFMAHGA